MDEELRAELLRRVEIDQVARKALDADAMREADAENLPWIKAVIAEHGWPGAALVGTDGAHSAWLLAQHADADPAFQRECLDLLTAAVEAGEARMRELAYLTDRVLLAEGQPQVYGTQVTRRGDEWSPRNLGDPDGVDARRAAAGLGPLAEYLARFAGSAVPAARIKCSDCDARTPFEPPDVDESVTVTCTGCGREMTITGPPRRLPGQAPPIKCPGCGAWASFEPPAPGESVSFTCPKCGKETTATFKG
jgi:DNA-directed RNA polymerase subunit RPC12/RpoP